MPPFLMSSAYFFSASTFWAPMPSAIATPAGTDAGRGRLFTTARVMTAPKPSAMPDWRPALTSSPIGFRRCRRPFGFLRFLDMPELLRFVEDLEEPPRLLLVSDLGLPNKSTGNM